MALQCWRLSPPRSWACCANVHSHGLGDRKQPGGIFIAALFYELQRRSSSSSFGYLFVWDLWWSTKILLFGRNIKKSLIVDFLRRSSGFQTVGGAGPDQKCKLPITLLALLVGVET
jgi:hypothetical protein